MQQDHSDCSRMAQHVLVLGSGGYLQPDPTVPARPAQCVDSAIQIDPSQVFVQPEYTCLASRASAIKDQSFSEAAAARIDSFQRGSTTSVFESKWTILTEWFQSN